MDDIGAHLQANPRQIFADDSFTASPPPPSRGSKLTGTVLATLQLFRAGHTPEIIARKREITAGTVLNHLAAAVEAGEQIDLREFVNGNETRRIEAALVAHPGVALTPVHEALGGRFDYGVIRLVKAVRDRSAR